MCDDCCKIVFLIILKMLSYSPGFLIFFFLVNIIEFKWIIFYTSIKMIIWMFFFIQWWIIMLESFWKLKHPWFLLKTQLSFMYSVQFSSVQFRHSVMSTLCDPVNCSTPGLPVHHQLLEFTQTHVHRISDAIQPSHPVSSPSPPAPNPSQHQSLFQWVNSLHEVAKVLEFQLNIISLSFRLLLG